MSGCLRFKLDDFSPAQQARIKAQLAPRSTIPALMTHKTHSRSPKTTHTHAPTPTNAHNLSLAPYSPISISAPAVRNLREDKMTSTERRFLSDILHGDGWFEPITLKLAGGSRYTPDFMYFDNGVPVLAECKGAYRLETEGRAHTAFMEAAARFSSIFRFVWARELPKGKGWDLKHVIPASSESSHTPTSNPSSLSSTSNPKSQSNITP